MTEWGSTPNYPLLTKIQHKKQQILISEFVSELVGFTGKKTDYK